MTKYWFFHHDNPDWHIRRKWSFCVVFDNSYDDHPIENVLRQRVSIKRSDMAAVSIAIDEVDELYDTRPLDLYEDFPWCPTNGGKYIVVSQDARVVLEAAAPGVFEYFPIDYTRPGSRRPQPIRLWLAHWLVCIDCFDRERSVWTPSARGDERHSWGYQGVVVQRSKIPADATIFELKHEGRLIFSDRAKRAVTKAKLVGAKFYPVPLSE